MRCSVLGPNSQLEERHDGGDDEAVVAKLLNQLSEVEIEQLAAAHRYAQRSYSVADAREKRRREEILVEHGLRDAQRWEQELDQELGLLAKTRV